MVTGRCTNVFRGIFFGSEGGVEGRELLEGKSPWMNFSGGKRISLMGVQDFLALFKQKRKNKYGKDFSTESKEQH